MFKSDNRGSYSLFLSCNDSERYCLFIAYPFTFRTKESLLHSVLNNGADSLCFEHSLSLKSSSRSLSVYLCHSISIYVSVTATHRSQWTRNKDINYISTTTNFSNRISLFLYIFGLCSLSIQSVSNCHISRYVILAHFVREKMTEFVTLRIAMIWIDRRVLMWSDWLLISIKCISLCFSFPLTFSLSLFPSPRNLQPVRGCTVWICYALLPSGRPWACKPLRTASATKRESRVGLRAPF